MDTKEIYLKKNREQIEKLEENSKDCDWLPEIPDEWEAKINTFYWGIGIAVNIRFDRSLYAVVDKYFESIGWTKATEKLDDKATGLTDLWTSKIFVPPEEEYTWYGKYVEVRFNPDMPGSICKRRIVGKKEEQAPVYEFSCEPIP